jgi:hypothetical protein
MRASSVVAVLMTMGAAQSSFAEPSMRSIEDWRRAMACQAHVDKLADENERGYQTFIAAARRDPKLRDQAAEIERTEQGNVRIKRVFAASARAGADAILASGYPQWRAAIPALPAKEDLLRREEAAARAVAAKPDNPQKLGAAITALGCEDLLGPTS